MLKATITEMTIHSDGDPEMLQDTTTVKLVNEGGGPFITLTQYDANFKEIVLRLDITEIPILFSTFNLMIKQ